MIRNSGNYKTLTLISWGFWKSLFPLNFSFKLKKNTLNCCYCIYNKYWLFHSKNHKFVFIFQHLNFFWGGLLPKKRKFTFIVENQNEQHLFKQIIRNLRKFIKVSKNIKVSVVFLKIVVFWNWQIYLGLSGDYGSWHDFVEMFYD